MILSLMYLSVCFSSDSSGSSGFLLTSLSPPDPTNAFVARCCPLDRVNRSPNPVSCTRVISLAVPVTLLIYPLLVHVDTNASSVLAIVNRVPEPNTPTPIPMGDCPSTEVLPTPLCFGENTSVLVPLRPLTFPSTI